MNLVFSLCYGVFIDLSGQTLVYYQLLCLLQARNTGAVDISWLASTAVVSVPGAGIKVRALTLVSPILTVTHVTHLLKNNVFSCLRLLIGSKKRSMTPKRFPTLQNRTRVPLIDPSVVTVVGAVDDQGIVKSPGSSSDKKKKQNTDKPKAQMSKDSKADKPSKLLKPTKSSQDSRFDQLDQKWSERFNRLEALLLAKSLEQPGPAFTTVKVTPTHSLHKTVVSSKPFIRPQPTPTTDRPPVLSTDLPGSVQTAFKSTSKSTMGKVSTDQPSDLAGADSPLSHQVPSRSSSAPPRRQSTSSMDTDSDTDISDRPPVDLFVEEGELSDQDLEASAADPDLTLSEEQNYRETMSGIRSFMGWSHIPEMDTAASRSEDNPFAGPKTQPTGKISVSMPTDEWLCSKMGKLNITLTEGYPSRSSEAGGLFKDQFVRPPKISGKVVQLCSEPTFW